MNSYTIIKRITKFTCLFCRAILCKVWQANTNSSSCSSLLQEQNCRIYVNIILKTPAEKERGEGGREINYIQIDASNFIPVLKAMFWLQAWGSVSSFSIIQTLATYFKNSLTFSLISPRH